MWCVAGRLARFGLFLWLVLAGATFSQEAEGFDILILDQERLFAESSYGRAVQAEDAKAAEALEAENTRIQDELVAEELELTDLRQSLSAEDFASRAEAFDQKVETIRAEQDAKVRDLGRRREESVQTFLAAVAPVLGEVLKDHGAEVILDKSTVILSLNAIDVTDEVIARIDEVLGVGAPQAP